MNQNLRVNKTNFQRLRTRTRFETETTRKSPIMFTNQVRFPVTDCLVFYVAVITTTALWLQRIGFIAKTKTACRKIRLQLQCITFVYFETNVCWISNLKLMQLCFLVKVSSRSSYSHVLPELFVLSGDIEFEILFPNWTDRTISIRTSGFWF